MIVLYQTWPTFAYTNLQIQNSAILGGRQRTLDEMFFVVLLSFLHAKQLLMELLVEILQTYANQLLGMMLAYYNPTRYVNPCPSVFICFGKSIQRQVESHLHKTRPVALKMWSCPIFSEQDQTANSRVSIQQAYRKKLTTCVLMVFLLIAAVCLMRWAVFITFAPVKTFDVYH